MQGVKVSPKRSGQVTSGPDRSGEVGRGKWAEKHGRYAEKNGKYAENAERRENKCGNHEKGGKPQGHPRGASKVVSDRFKAFLSLRTHCRVGKGC